MMTKYKHTPGPWKYEPATLRWGIFIITADKERIAEVIHGAPEGEPTARLIAQAPTLYSETKALVSCLVEDPSIGSILDILNDTDFERITGHLQKLEGAIAAAEADDE
jgi:hypothetical protein